MHFLNAFQRGLVNLVGIQAAQVFGEALAGFLRANGSSASGRDVRLSVAVLPSCGRLNTMVSLLRVNSILSSPTALRTGPSIRLASHPARTSSAGSVARPDTSADSMGSCGVKSTAEVSSARQ